MRNISILSNDYNNNSRCRYHQSAISRTSSMSHHHADEGGDELLGMKG
jgi:hypothetical protein